MFENRYTQCRDHERKVSLTPGNGQVSEAARARGPLLAAIRKLRKQGVGINKIARKLGIGVSVVQRIISGGAK